MTAAETRNRIAAETAAHAQARERVWQRRLVGARIAARAAVFTLLVVLLVRGVLLVVDVHVDRFWLAATSNVVLLLWIIVATARTLGAHDRSL